MKSTLLGVNFLLQGAVGTGKTSSVKTLIGVSRKLGIPPLEIFALFTEPRYDVLGKDVLDQIHWRYIAPGSISWDTMYDIAKMVGGMSNPSLEKIGSIQQDKHNQFLDMLSLLANFRDQNGQAFGPVDAWGTNRVLIIDGLTGISKMSRALKVGAKPILSQPDWGVAMHTILSLFDKLTNDTRCHLIVMAHIEMERDEVAGSTKMMVSTLGRKLAPILPTNFGDVVMARKEGTNYYWDVLESRADLKTVNLTPGSKLEPDFTEVFKAWLKRGGEIETP